MKELLRLEKVSYSYNDTIPALKQISTKIHEGERIAVLGNNGAGKSTFFLCCNGVLKPQEGSMYLEGNLLSEAKKDTMLLRQAVGLVFQEPDAQIIAATVENEVSFGPMNLRLGNEEVVHRVHQSLKQMNLDGYQDRAPQYLSGGEKKRVTIADILAMQPKMILFDEPTASLDPANVSILERVLKELSDAGITLVISTHDVDFAFRFAQRALIFNEGAIIADDEIEEIFSSEEILRQAGLEKPLLYATFEALENELGVTPPSKKPRTVPDFLSRLDGLKKR